jgi:hypothetical protein
MAIPFPDRTNRLADDELALVLIYRRLTPLQRDALRLIAAALTVQPAPPRDDKDA